MQLSMAACGMSMGCSLGAKRTSPSSEHILFPQGPITAEVKAVDWHWGGQTKMTDSSIQMSSSFVCLYCAKSKFKCEGDEEKQVILILRAWVRHHAGHDSINPGEERSKHWLLNWPGVNIQSRAMRGMASTVGHVDAVHLPQIQSQVFITRGCKASCDSYLRFKTVTWRQESSDDCCMLYADACLFWAVWFGSR